MTSPQGRVLRALDLLTRDGWPASIEEVMLQAGYQSKSTVHEHVLALEQLGLVFRHPRRAHGGWRTWP